MAKPNVTQGLDNLLVLLNEGKTQPAPNAPPTRARLEDFSQKVKPGTKKWLNRFKLELRDRRRRDVLIADIVNEALAAYFRENADVLDAEKQQELLAWLRE